MKFPKAGYSITAACLLLIPGAPMLAADPVQDRLDTLSASTKALPAQTDAQKAKNAVLDVALERAQSLLDSKNPAKALALENDVAAALSQNAGIMALANTRVPHVLLFTPVRVREGNPHLNALVAQAHKTLAVPDFPWPVCTSDKATFQGLTGPHGTRSSAADIRNDLWLYANPASPLCGNPELLTRLLRRAHAFVDALDIAGDQANPDLDDQFTEKDAYSALYEFISCYPGLLLPSQRADWDRVLRKCADRLWNGIGGRGGMKDARGWNLNQELARMIGVLNLGYYTQNQTMIDGAISLVAKVLPKMYPDGGWPYNGSGNPCCNYEDEVAGDLTRIFDQTGYAPIRDALIASQWEGPVSGRTNEMWTSPFFKAYRWNVAKGTAAGGESVATLSRNGYVRTILDSNAPVADRDLATWYDNSVAPVPLPDGYIILDRNIGGPRAWYGRFTYAGSFRSPPSKEAGLETLMGAMTVDPDGRVNSVLVDVTPRVRLASYVPPPGRMSNGSVDGNAGPEVAKQSTDMTGVTLVAKNFSVSSAIYTLATTRQDAYKGPSSDWATRQIWIGLPDRLIGLISTVPKKDGAQAYEIDGVLRLISRGTAGAVTCKTIETIGPDHYRYGTLDIFIHESTYGACDAQVIPYRLPAFPATELTLRDTRSLNAGNQPLRYPADTNLQFIVEIRPSWVASPATASPLSTGGLVGLRVTSGGKTWLTWFNPTLSSQKCALPNDLPQGLPQVMRISESGKPEMPSLSATSPFVLDPFQQAVLVCSTDPADAQPGWKSFQEMANTKAASRAQ